MPEKLLKKEKDHIKGFAPEIGAIERIGNIKIDPLVIRPTSEVLFANLFAKEVSTYKNLPIMYNQ
jgi:prolyl-tRNA synthetase